MNDGTKGTVQAWINPLRISALDDWGGARDGEPPNANDILEDLCWGQRGCARDEMTNRYMRLTEIDCVLFAVPADRRILRKIIWPLFSAKKCFCLGDFLGCIALSGVVCEMATVFLFDLLRKSRVVRGAEDAVAEVFRTRKYEHWGQERRLTTLRDWGAIPNSLYLAAEKVRSVRREYLHLITKSASRIEQDAHDAYVAAFAVVKELVALPVSGRGLSVPLHLDSYLRAKKLQSDAPP